MRNSRLAAALAASLAAAVVAPSSFLVATFAAEPRAEASLAAAATLKHLVTLSDTVVDGTPEEAKAVWEDVPGIGKRIVTYTRVNVEQAAYGSPDKTIWVRTLGGVVGKIGQRVEGEAVLVPGERAVLFLKSSPEGHFRVVEMAQGHYPLVKEADVPRLQKSPHLAGVLRGNERAAHEVLVGKAVGEAFDLVRTERKAAGL